MKANIFNNAAIRYTELSKVIREYIGACTINSREFNEETGEMKIIVTNSLRDEYHTTTFKSEVVFKALASGKGFCKKPIKDETLSMTTRANFFTRH